MCRIDGDIQNLHVAVHDHAAGKAQQLTVVVRHPPAARRSNVLTQLGQEHTRRPRLVSGAFKACRLQSARALGICCAHGAKLQMTAGELVGNARNLALRALGKTEALALVFLGIRKTRIDRQDTSRIAVARGVCHQQALTRGPPQVALHAASGLILAQQFAIAHEAVTSQLNLIPVRGLAPLIQGHGGLDHALALKLTLGSLVTQHVQRRIHLTAHGIGQNAQLATHASLPRRPGASIERRYAQQRHVGTACQTLGSRDADAHAGKRTRTATDDVTADIAAAQTGLGQYTVNGIHELNIGVTAAQVIATCKPQVARLLIDPAYRAGKHVGRSIERHHRRVVVMQAHLVQPYQSNGKAPPHARRAPRVLSFARRYRPRRA